MKMIYSVMLALGLISLISFSVSAQTLTITAAGRQPYTISKGMFQDMKQSVVMAKAHDEKVHRYTGVTIADLLTKAGIILGDTAKRQSIVSYVLITATDNYKAIYALPEIDPLFANRPVLLADKKDKRLLPLEEGPFQVIVPGEKKHARWIRQVSTIEVVTIKQ